jgi:hypothetical protein
MNCVPVLDGGWRDRAPLKPLLSSVEQAKMAQLHELAG